MCYTKLNTEVNFIISLSLLIILQKFQNSSSETQYTLQHLTLNLYSDD